MYEAVLFDLDGTLIDSNSAILACFKSVLSKLQITYPGDTIVSAEFGKPLEYFVEYLHIPPESADKFISGVRSCVHQHSPKYFPKIPNLLAKLHSMDIKMAIITSKAKQATLQNVQELGLNKYIPVIISAQDVIHPKPAPDPLLKALDLLNLQPSMRIAYVGDTVNDMLAAQAAGITAIGVGWGLHALKLQHMTNIIYIKSINQLQAEIFK